MAYPASCLRGIPNAEFLDEDGEVLPHLFDFKKEHERLDGWIEESINWEDDDGALAAICSQTKENGRPQFSSGVARVPLNALEYVRDKMKDDQRESIFSFERQPRDDNRYHGNLLLKSNKHKKNRKIMGYLAMVSVVTHC